jgi:hypothetical protein
MHAAEGRAHVEAGGDATLDSDGSSACATAAARARLSALPAATPLIPLGGRVRRVRARRTVDAASPLATSCAVLSKARIRRTPLAQVVAIGGR